ncbi:MAG: MFS transporter [Pseudomonadota bacterium]
MSSTLSPGADAALPTVGELPRSLKLGWGSGALGVALLMNGVSGLILFYLVSVLKLDPFLAGALIFVSKLFDVVTDPLVGYWSDQAHSPRGRRRPFLFWSAFICAGSFVMIFSTPMFDAQWLTATYVLIAMLIYTLGYTLFNVPYMSMPAEMTDSYHERSSIHGYRMAFVTTGSFIAGSLMPVLLQRLGRTEWSSYTTIGLIGGGVILVSMLFCYYATADARHTRKGGEMPNFAGEFSAMWANKHFLRLIGIKLAQLTGVASVTASMLFFLTNSLQQSFDILAVFGISTTIVSLIAIPALVTLSKKVGKRQGYFVAATANVLYSLSWIWAVPGEPTWYFAVRGAIVGVAFAGNVIFAMSMLTDIIDWDARRTGVRREGVYTSLYSFVEKFSAAFGPLIVGAALSIAGFNKELPPEAAQDPAVSQALLLGVSYLPAVCGVIAIFLLIGYRLTEEELAKAGPAAS